LKELRDNLQQKIDHLLIEYKSLGHLDGYSGDVIRPSLCSFIENISRSVNYFRSNNDHHGFSMEMIDAWQSILDLCLASLDDDIRQAGLKALKAFSDAFYATSR
jgi:hypothetical protein